MRREPGECDENDRRNGSTASPHDVLLEAIDTIPDGFVVYDSDDRLVLCNRAFRELNAGVADRLVPGVDFSDILAAKVALARGDATNEADLTELRCGVDCAAHCRRWTDCRTRAHAQSDASMFETTPGGRWIRVDEHRTPSGFKVGLRTDLTTVRDVQSQLSRSETKFRTLYAMAPVGIVRTDGTGQIVDANPAFAVITGSSPDDRRRFADLFDPRDRAAVATDLVFAAAVGAYGPVERRLVGPDGSEVTLWLQGTRVDGPDGETSIWSILQDITERKRSEEMIWHAAHHDGLTGLPNRKFLSERLAARLERGDPTALLLVDLDNFKLVNDTLGHEAGDVLLGAVAGRLREGVRAEDFVARFGGDEFAIVLDGVADAEEASTVTERLFRRLDEDIDYRGRNIRVGVSIGIALAPEGGEAGDVLREADLALYEAKRAGRDQARLYDPSMQADSRRRFDVQAATRRALAEGRIVPHYQPIVSLEDGTLEGVEALCRVRDAVWPTPLEIFADRELARDVDLRMIEAVLDDMLRWQAAGLSFGRVAVNVCDQNLWSDDFEARILEGLSGRRIDPRLFGIEVTETALLEIGDRSPAPRLTRFARMGLAVALDDFGTGFASLVHLKALPVDRVKIDRSFVADIVFDAASRAIVQALVQLGNGLGKTVVAEGVETDGQRKALIDLGCRLAQGHLFGRPMAAADLEAAWGRADAAGGDTARVSRGRVV